jgi:hypothetical protein
LPEFTGTTQASEVGAQRATARLPGLDIEIVHRRSPDRDTEQLTINVLAMPSFEAFGKALEAANPFVFWAEANRLIWSAWLEAASAMMPGVLAPRLPEPMSKPRSRALPPVSQDPRRKD